MIERNTETMDIKNHILSMTPGAQNMLLKNAVTEGRLDILNQLIEIMGEQREPLELIELVATEMQKVIENDV